MTTNTAVLLQKDIILDACSIYSLYATGQFIPILECIPSQIYVASYVENVELKQLYNPVTDSCDIPIDLAAAKQASLILVAKPQAGPEALDAVNFAAGMSKKRIGKNTGEAISGAIAKTRNWGIVTDDVDASHFLSQQGLASSLTTTLHILEFWSNVASPSWSDIQQALQRVRVHARYGPPPKDHPLLTWWHSFKIKI